MIKTDWFDGSKYVPAHVGLYERMYFTAHGLPENILPDYWDGENWIYQVFGRILNQNVNWRGLKEQELPAILKHQAW